MADNYVCTLTEASLKKAKDELNEDPKERMASVATLRDWIIAQPHIKCPGDMMYLLRFLRAAKFSQLGTRAKLEKWISTMDKMSDWLREIDFSDPKYLDFFDTGYIVPLPGTNEQNQRVMIIRQGQIDTSGRFTKGFTVKALFGTLLAMLYDENTQVNGIMFMFDMTGYEMRHIRFFSIEDNKNFAKLWQGALPCRLKGFQVYNGGAVFEMVLQAVMPILKKKIKERLVLHGSNLENIYKVIPMHMLPDEYLPDDYAGKSAGPIKGLIEKLKNKMTTPEVVAQIRYETGMDFAVDESKRTTAEQASYMKLHVE